MLIKSDKHSHVMTFELQCVEWLFIAHITVRLLNNHAFIKLVENAQPLLFYARVIIATLFPYGVNFESRVLFSFLFLSQPAELIV